MIEKDLLFLENKIINLCKDKYISESLMKILVDKINYILNNSKNINENYNIITEMRFDLSFAYSNNEMERKIFASLLFYLDLLQEEILNNI